MTKHYLSDHITRMCLSWLLDFLSSYQESTTVVQLWNFLFLPIAEISNIVGNRSVHSPEYFRICLFIVHQKYKCRFRPMNFLGNLGNSWKTNMFMKMRCSGKFKKGKWAAGVLANNYGSTWLEGDFVLLSQRTQHLKIHTFLNFQFSVWGLAPLVNIESSIESSRPIACQLCNSLLNIDQVAKRKGEHMTNWTYGTV